MKTEVPFFRPEALALGGGEAVLAAAMKSPVASGDSGRGKLARATGIRRPQELVAHVWFGALRDGEGIETTSILGTGSTPDIPFGSGGTV